MGDELKKRKIKDCVSCPYCFRGESFYHCFWGCQYVKEAWKELERMSAFMWPSFSEKCRSSGELKWWTLNTIVSSQEEPLCLWLWLMYELWQTRNATSRGEAFQNPKEVARRVCHLAEEWAIFSSSAAVRQSREKENWKPPPAGWFKINIDGALNKGLDSGGAGAVIRRDDGNFVAAKCSSFQRVVDPLLAELLAVRMAVSMALDQRLNKVIIELDCAEAVKKLNCNEFDRLLVGPLVQEIKGMCLCIFQIKFVWCCRDANMCAHVLAKAGCNVGASELWMESPPPMLEHLFM